jgi:endoglucanase
VTTHTNSRSVTVNQIGYPADAAKIAYFTGGGRSFEVVNAATGEAVYRGETGTAVQDAASGVAVAAGDFSAVTAPGHYRIAYEGSVSAEFEVSEQPYAEVHRGLLKAFYYYRCGTELTEEFAGPWTHGPCHMSHGIVHGDPDRRLDGCGGWHDAGDYGKYTGPGAKAVADLLLAFELYPSAFSRAIPLPETDDRMPDVLHECRWELDFLMKMQDPETGGAFHKLTTLKFPPLDTRPEDDLGDLYFSPISVTATADFAAVMALAARIYRPYDAAYAERCLAAAKRAAAWLEQNPELPGFKNPNDVFTGEYGDRRGDADERYWAAAELYRTTGDAAYHEQFKKLAAGDFPKYELGWADMGGYGTIAYLLGGESQADAALYATLKQGLRAEAERIAAICKADGYGVSLGQTDYKWGSNMNVMNNAMLLLIAYHVHGDAAFEACALDQVHYLLGRNVLDTSYVTGFGDRAYNEPHYRPGVADGIDEAVPGFVSGGPNAGLQDDAMKAHLTGKPPAQCFIDHKDSYAGNEVTIYWNSPAVFAFSHWVK